MQVYKIKEKDLSSIFKYIGVTKSGTQIMQKKSKIELFFIKDIKTPAANILKQEALSVGADLAVPMHTIDCKSKKVDSLLMATNAHIDRLIKKLSDQPFGLKDLSDELKKHTLNQKHRSIKIMGVINANEDSFYPNSRFVDTKAIKAIEKMIDDGADIIDIGAVSSRPGSEYPGLEVEFNRLKPIVEAIYQERLYEKVDFSLDSFSDKCLDFALSRGFKIANDITALSSKEYAKVVSSYDATVILMHKKGSPKDMQKNPNYDDVIAEVSEFFKQRIDIAKNFNISKIILDVGIGFGKTLEHNVLLIKYLEHFLNFGYELLVGASRKSMIDMIVKSDVTQRLPGTISLHLTAIENGASIVRVHDVKEHYQAIKVFEKFL